MHFRPREEEKVLGRAPVCSAFARGRRAGFDLMRLRLALLALFQSG